MLIIPVLDIRQGQVVHARAGRRESYQPIRSSLCRCSDPKAVITDILTIYPFTTLYIADLDAIEGTGNNHGLMDELCGAFSSLTFWIDSGIKTSSRLIDNFQGHCKAVVGSEYQQDSGSLSTLLQHNPPPILSLDFAGERLQGPDGMLEAANLWPQEIIVMSLTRVGTSRGPDLDRVAFIKALAPEKSTYAAGGIRHEKDLWALKKLGIAGALVATALHNRRIDRHSIGALLNMNG